jgi:mono/diheme cytochrome c family protein
MVLAAVLAATLATLHVAAQTHAPRPQPPLTRPVVPDSQRELVAEYCVTCHNATRKAGGLALESFDLAQPETTSETAEKMIRKLTAGLMPPAGSRRPDAPAMAAFLKTLESRMDEAAALDPNPGWRPFQRLNRAEYGRAVKDLLDVDVDVTPYLPPDTVSAGYDNVADTQAFSPALLEGYLRAASQISRIALGDRTAAPASTSFKVPSSESQMRHIEGTPFGTRGGLSVVHTFPADGGYAFKVELVRTVTGELFGNTYLAVTDKNDLIEISVNGVRAAVLEVSPRMSEADRKGLTLETPPIQITAGPQRIAAAFISRSTGPVDDLIAPVDYMLIDTRIGTGFGITAPPHLQELTVTGPFAVTGVSETPSRRRIFSCRPRSASEEPGCAADIIRRLATHAYRGTLPREDFADLMHFYDEGRKDGDFESGVRLAIQGILANPRFLFRIERGVSPGSAPGATLKAARAYRISDIELASRLSFFLWAAVPDAELVKAATQGTLGTPAVLRKQVRRMLADRRSEALATRFAAQWLRLQDIEKIRPDGLLYPYWDRELSDGFRRETELLFDSIVHEDRSVLDLLTADYSFVNERLAQHYGIPNVTGSEFRRVTLPDNRRGILGHGSILLLTSVADRTSPVQRGKWIMQVLLGTPPPPPPPDVPALETTKTADGARVLSVRERMESHRKSPACTSCHRVIDPLGLALENYDVTGRWRIKDNGALVDSTGELYDGTRIDGPAGLRRALLTHQDAVLVSFAENLMTYAMGRRVEYFDMPAIRAIIRDASNNDLRLSSFVLGVVNSAGFRMSRPDARDITAGGIQ